MTKCGSPDYVITRETKAVMAKDNPYYRTLVYEGGRQRHLRYTLKQIAENSCLEYGLELEDRSRTVKEILHSSSKLPIPVHPAEGIFMIPTTSMKNSDCVLVAYHHIHFFDQRDHKGYIGFRDGTGLYVNTSKSTLDIQYRRTSQLIVHLNWEKIFRNRETG
ncbi:competence protein ComK [Lentibacillus sediminis]|uniref:competence protein ComK n=1 Tax=Lentibacillus sediminis TaxID=1940529 RepID=UPI000C1C59BD|nr:competence protein ComK [Lentibacillus sediminis]